ncbi:hypothetical protein Slin14017_G090380 [Septoria linicola]|nr:hypothetical protein Slin14017_G090380 [Septoria linicola]
MSQVDRTVALQRVRVLGGANEFVFDSSHSAPKHKRLMSTN